MSNQPRHVVNPARYPTQGCPLSPYTSITEGGEVFRRIRPASVGRDGIIWRRGRRIRRCSFVGQAAFIFLVLLDNRQLVL
jgi:hypothetical protein